MIFNTAKARKFGRMVVCIKENIKTLKKMVRVYSNGQMVLNMRVGLKIIRWMGWECLFGQIREYIQGLGKMVK
jgi:hypothetical protein